MTALGRITYEQLSAMVSVRYAIEAARDDVSSLFLEARGQLEAAQARPELHGPDVAHWEQLLEACEDLRKRLDGLEVRESVDRIVRALVAE